MFYSPVQDLQRPTHPRLRIRDSRDAQIVLEAVRIGVLQAVERRLNEGERNMFIRSGAVFVWEESDGEYGLKRWTDGRMWTPSRAREPFLFYECLKQALPRRKYHLAIRTSNDAPPLISIDRCQSAYRIRIAGSYRFVEISPQSQPASSLITYSYSQHERQDIRSMSLVKQAYSSWTVDPKGEKKKWHITAYFTKSDWNDLPAPTGDPSLAKIKIPSGIYQVGRPRHKPEEDHDRSTSNGGHGHAFEGSSTMYSQEQHSVPIHYYDERFPEDQRVIRMLNSQHIM
ncbi:hypothetical protein Clacol_006791 [Clathrus columnatus]|uniref:Gti1/Pac2 family-domain-containing protein n=1 Tax=Clathrus columnatus TaxID=1419009 RepID=A0AAV5AHE1_9AGAM|nr:hypothetical protein Clacol_006791 [Clathrus columnatus]